MKSPGPKTVIKETKKKLSNVYIFWLPALTINYNLLICENFSRNRAVCLIQFHSAFRIFNKSKSFCCVITTWKLINNIWKTRFFMEQKFFTYVSMNAITQESGGEVIQRFVSIFFRIFHSLIFYSSVNFSIKAVLMSSLSIVACS